MEINYGSGKTEHGPGVLIKLSGDEIAVAIRKYLEDSNVTVSGPSTLMVNGELINEGTVCVDPSGSVTYEMFYSGRGPNKNSQED